MLCDSETIVSEELVRNSILLREAAWSGYQLGVHCSMWQLLYIYRLRMPRGDLSRTAEVGLKRFGRDGGGFVGVVPDKAVRS
jgi:hypothetical protein